MLLLAMLAPWSPVGGMMICVVIESGFTMLRDTTTSPTEVIMATLPPSGDLGHMPPAPIRCPATCS